MGKRWIKTLKLGETVSGERILVVDDSAEVRDFLANTALKPEGYQVETARNGLEGMEMAIASPPDLIITDNAMPKMTGLEMIAGLRAQKVDTPAILMTAEGSEEIAAQSFRVGVRYYFIKPFDPEELLAAILAIFPGSEAQEAATPDEPAWGGGQALAALAALNDAVLVADDWKRLIYANEAATPFLKKPDEAVGRRLATALKDPNLVNLLSGDASTDAVEYPTDDGRTYLARIRIVAGVGHVAFLEDITRAKNIDEKRNEFVTTVAHDLRSPMTGILSYLELMTRVGELTPQQIQFTTQMREAVEQMTNLLNDLLELSQIESGRETRREQVSLWDVAEIAARNLRERVDSKGQKLVIEGQSANLMVEGNARRLNQVFTNLIENAIKYTPENGTIKVSLTHMHGQAMASVVDTGIGIPQKDIAHVFDKFYRVDEIASKYEGTGLGLSIVKSIVEAHNGRIWVESSAGNGATFTVVLPAIEA